MRQAIYNISAIKDDTYPGASFAITVNGTAVNLVGATITMVIARDDGTVIKTIDNGTTGGITVAGAIFSIDEFIPTFDEGQYFYDIKIVFATGSTKTYIKGKFCLIGEIE